MTPLLIEIIASVIFGCFAAAVFSYLVLIAWASARRIRRGEFFRRRQTVVRAFEIPVTGSVVVRSDPFGTGAIWTSLLILIPLLFLAIWSVVVEMTSRAIGYGLIFAVVHSFLLWQLVRLGTHVQRRVVISRATLSVQPVFGARREVDWSAIRRVKDVTYAGPAVSGLYVYPVDGEQIVLDRWLPDWESLRYTVRTLTPSAEWTSEQRAAIG